MNVGPEKVFRRESLLEGTKNKIIITQCLIVQCTLAQFGPEIC